MTTRRTPGGTRAGEPARVRARAGGSAYDVLVGSGLLARLGGLVRDALGDTPAAVCVFEDANIPKALRDAACASFAPLTPTRHALTLDEASKSLATYGHMLGVLADAGVERAGGAVVAIGGGILTDVAGFAAATFRRGVPMVQCPTTLLAMVDATVGGKTGVNLARQTASGAVLLKNYAGAFHQPSLVVADVDALASLPERTLRCGLAECVKHAVIAGQEEGPLSLGWLEDAVGPHPPDAAAMCELVRTNAAFKAVVVESDERETADAGGRAALNLGHTFAHAIEASEHCLIDAGPGAPPARPEHGEAVAIGLVAAFALAEHADGLDPAQGQRVARLLAQAGLPTRLRAAPPADVLLEAMRLDKKSRGGRLRVVLPLAGGGVRVMAGPSEPMLRAAWARVLPA